MTDPTQQPRLVLVHGTRMSSEQWRPYRTLLDGVEVVAVDLPGHGSRVGEEFTMDRAVETVAVAVDSRSTQQPVVLVGHSLGGYVASVYAARHLGEVDALVLVGATADPAGPLTAVYRGFAALVPLVSPQRLARMVNVVLRALGVRGEAAAALPDGAAYAALPAAWEAVINECGPDLLRELRCPVVLVNGQWDQMRLDVRRYAAATAHPRVVTIPRATHLAPITHVQAVAAVLQEVADLASLRGRPAARPTIEE